MWPRLIPRGSGEVTGSRRLGKLRDIGADLARTPWLAYIDDDDEWLTNHLHDLLATAASSGAPAVHSWMSVVTPDGRPFLEETYPWCRDALAARQQYREMVECGVVVPHTNVYRHRVDADSVPMRVSAIAAGEWLLRRTLVQRVGFTFDYSPEEYAAMKGEDDKFLEGLLAEGTRIASTNEATLVYRLANSNGCASLDW